MKCSFISSQAMRMKPVKVGETLDLNIIDVSRRGDGVAKVKGFVVFVSNAKKGEKVKAKVKFVKEKFAVAERL